jgi:hypothetical protein
VSRRGRWIKLGIEERTMDFPEPSGTPTLTRIEPEKWILDRVTHRHRYTARTRQSCLESKHTFDKLERGKWNWSRVPATKQHVRGSHLARELMVVQGMLKTCSVGINLSIQLRQPQRFVRIEINRTTDELGVKQPDVPRCKAIRKQVIVWCTLAEPRHQETDVCMQDAQDVRM